ncbi:hypothetical protein OQA88_3307 [Cercophora sp. LCS_1]
MALLETSLDAINVTRLAITISSIFILTLIIREFQSWYRLRHVPGPFWNSLTNLPLARLAGKGRISFELDEIQTEYGPLMRIGPDLVMYGDADTYRLINGARSEFTKGDWYKPSKITPNDSIFTMSDDAERVKLKAKLTPGYARHDLIEQHVDHVLGDFIDLIERNYISTDTDYRPVDFAHKAMYFAIDTISQIAWGEQMGFIANDEDMYKYLEINDGFFPVLAVLLTMPKMDKYLKAWPLKLLLPKEGDTTGFGKMIRFVGFHSAHINYLTTGSDSTATAIRTTLLCLLSNPTSLAKLRHEIDTAIATRKISAPITSAEARTLPYLQSVIKENIRLYPPSTGWNGRCVPKGGVHIHGYYLPAGTQVAVNTVHMMRRKEVFGEDADVFRPERWFQRTGEDGDETRLKEMAATVELAFGFGRFGCLGRGIAGVELDKIFVESG